MSPASSIGRIDFSHLESRYQFVLVLPQSDTERLLEEHLKELGVAVERGTTLKTFVQTDDAVTCTIVGPGGEEQMVQTPWLIGCDGAHSIVRHDLGLSFDGDTMDESFVLADVQVRGLTVPATEIGIFWSPDGTLMFFPIGHDRYRLIADVGETPRHDPTLAEVQAIVDARTPGGITLTDAVWLSGFTINERMVPQYRTGRVLVAGDAAHIHSPAGGQGMNTGMQDAINLAWKLALVVKNKALVSLLDSYHDERSAVAQHVIAASGKLTRVGLMKGQLEQTLRDFVAHHLLGHPWVQRQATEQFSELTIGYPNSPLNRGHVHHARETAGERFESGDPFGAGQEPRFALCAADSEDARAFIARHADLMEHEPRKGSADGLLRLIRPDGFVAAISTQNHWAPLDDCLSSIAAPS
jgi:2-polyprenyl-6-methoxyphenol hydroxylase-like FAD-dependent oxidoreductase